MSKFQGISEDLLNDGFNVRISTRGLSMFPLISTGDKITIARGKAYETGNLIVFKKDEQMVCHRLAKVFEAQGVRYYQTRGDSFFSLDEPITADQILGKVIKIERTNVSLPRNIMLLLHPALRFGRLNAFAVSTLMKIRQLLPLKKSP